MATEIVCKALWGNYMTESCGTVKNCFGLEEKQENREF